MIRVKHYSIEVMEYEYEFEEKQKLIGWLEQRHGMGYSIKRSGPKLISVGRCHKTLHHMVIHITK